MSRFSNELIHTEAKKLRQRQPYQKLSLGSQNVQV